MAQLRPFLDRIHVAGAELAIVGNGDPRYGRAFAETHQLKSPLFTDPTLESYRAAGFHRGIWRTLGLRGAKNAIRAFRQGFRQGPLQGDPWQEGGVLVINKGGNILYTFASASSGDHPPPESVMAALESQTRIT